MSYGLAGPLGALRHAITRRWPTAAEVGSVFPELSRGETARVARRIAALHERNRVLVHSILRHGLGPLRPRVAASDAFQSVRGPMILGTFHIGAVHAFAPALERLAVPVLAFREGRLFKPQGALSVESTAGDSQARAAAVHGAMAHLRAGGIVFMALDVAPGEASVVRTLDQDLRVAPGAFALAQWTGAPLVTAFARWTGSRVLVDLGERIATPQDAGHWLESYLRAFPAETTLGLLRNLLGHHGDRAL